MRVLLLSNHLADARTQIIQSWTHCVVLGMSPDFLCAIPYASHRLLRVHQALDVTATCPAPYPSAYTVHYFVSLYIEYALTVNNTV